MRVEKYALGLWQTIVLGTPCDLKPVAQPQLDYKPEWCMSNMLIELQEWFFDGRRWEGVIMRHLQAQGSYCPHPGYPASLTGWPIVEKGKTIEVRAKYDGRIPQGMKKGEKFTFVVTFIGLGKR